MAADSGRILAHAVAGSTLYGTAAGGTFGDGVVYAVDASGTERLIYGFKSTPDGRRPVGGLVFLDGDVRRH